MWDELVNKDAILQVQGQLTIPELIFPPMCLIRTTVTVGTVALSYFLSPYSFLIDLLYIGFLEYVSLFDLVSHKFFSFWNAK